MRELLNALMEQIISRAQLITDEFIKERTKDKQGPGRWSDLVLRVTRQRPGIIYPVGQANMAHHFGRKTISVSIPVNKKGTGPCLGLGNR